MTAPITLICGGIGSGKSVVSKILQTLGYEVYDCDASARRIMDESIEIQQQLNEQIDPLAVVNGKINRPLIASRVFSNPNLLLKLNAIVHTAVLHDILNVRLRPEPLVNTAMDIPLFVETAIPVSSGLIDYASEIWFVYAPTPLRILRVHRRSHLSPSEISARIQSQQPDTDFHHPRKHTILNAPSTPLLPQIHSLLQ